MPLSLLETRSTGAKTRVPTHSGAGASVQDRLPWMLIPLHSVGKCVPRSPCNQGLLAKSVVWNLEPHAQAPDAWTFSLSLRVHPACLFHNEGKMMSKSKPGRVHRINVVVAMVVQGSHNTPRDTLTHLHNKAHR
jgi:hypothetical protein